MDPVSNFAYTFIDIPPDPADSGTTAKLRAGGAFNLPRGGPFNVVVWKPGVIATKGVSELLRLGTITEATISEDSDGDSAGDSDIHIVGSDFNADGGTCGVLLSDNTFTTITYTSYSAGHLFGCTGGVGTLHTGDRIVDDWISFDRAQEGSWPRLIKHNDQVLAAITKKWFDDLVAFVSPPSQYFIQATVQRPDTSDSWTSQGAFYTILYETMTPPPSILNPGDHIPWPDMEVESLPNVSDGYDIAGRVVVVNADYSEMIVVQAFGFIPLGTFAGGIDWSTAEIVGTQVGTDLSIDGESGILSAGGGIYNTYYQFGEGEPD